MTPVVAYAIWYRYLVKLRGIADLKTVMMVGGRGRRLARHTVSRRRKGLMVVGSEICAVHIEVEFMAVLEAVVEEFGTACAWGGAVAEVEGAVAGIGGGLLVLMGEVLDARVGLNEGLGTGSRFVLVYTVD